VRWSGRKDQLLIGLEPGLVARVAAAAFELDPAQLTLPTTTSPMMEKTPDGDCTSPEV